MTKAPSAPVATEQQPRPEPPQVPQPTEPERKRVPRAWTPEDVLARPPSPDIMPDPPRGFKLKGRFKPDDMEYKDWFLQLVEESLEEITRSESTYV